jgi:hypothetical protein
MYTQHTHRASAKRTLGTVGIRHCRIRRRATFTNMRLDATICVLGYATAAYEVYQDPSQPIEQRVQVLFAFQTTSV